MLGKVLNMCEAILSYQQALWTGHCKNMNKPGKDSRLSSAIQNGKSILTKQYQIAAISFYLWCS